jgi:hypothetical protein
VVGPAPQRQVGVRAMCDQELALSVTLLTACLAGLGADGASFSTADRSGV